jgi:hypothetical protein
LNFRRVLLIGLWVVGALAAGPGCGGGDDEAAFPTAKPIIEGNAVQIFVREAHKVGWWDDGDPIELESEPLGFADALAQAQKLGLAIYPTEPGAPPYEDGLPGYFVTARGEFYDVADGETPGPDTGRRPAVAVAFIDRQGRLSYGMRFVDGTPAATAPAG